MATLKELLEGGDLGAGQSKTASANVTSHDIDGMDKLAMQLGLFGETTKEAEYQEEDATEEYSEEKTAGFGGGGLHGLLFPDSVIGSQEKFAYSQEAAVEHAMGANAYDQFSASFDSFVEKLAGEVLSGSVHGDSQPTNHLPNNKAGGHDSIDTDGMVDDEISPKQDAKQVGQVKSAAFRKHMLLSMLEG